MLSCEAWALRSACSMQFHEKQERVSLSSVPWALSEVKTIILKKDLHAPGKSNIMDLPTCTRLPKRSMFGLVAGTAHLLGINLFLASPCRTSMTSPATPCPSTSCRDTFECLV